MTRVFEREIHIEGYRKVNKCTDGSVIAFEADDLAWIIDPDGLCMVLSEGGPLTLGAEEVYLLAPPELLEVVGP